MILKILTYLLVVLCATAFAATATPLQPWPVRTQPLRLINGSPAVFRIAAPRKLTSLTATWFGHQVFFDYDRATRRWIGFAGVSLSTRPGLYALTLQGTTLDGTELNGTAEIAVHAGKYRTIAVTVARRFTEPDEQEVKKIKSDVDVKKDLLNRVLPEAEWSGKFLAPVKAPISGVFGTRRTFNGDVQSTHQGLDYAVPTGTPVFALNRGTVLLARPMYFEGNCVILDHGQGLMSIYMHLSKIEVQEGELVGKGTQVGLSGGTGRATGPHLHVALRWQGIYLNPATVMTLNLPAIARKSPTPPKKASPETSAPSGSHPSSPDFE